MQMKIESDLLPCTVRLSRPWQHAIKSERKKMDDQERRGRKYRILILYSSLATTSELLRKPASMAYLASAETYRAIFTRRKESHLLSCGPAERRRKWPTWRAHVTRIYRAVTTTQPSVSFHALREMRNKLGSMCCFTRDFIAQWNNMMKDNIPTRSKNIWDVLWDCLLIQLSGIHWEGGARGEGEH